MAIGLTARSSVDTDDVIGCDAIETAIDSAFEGAAIASNGTSTDGAVEDVDADGCCILLL